MRHRKLSTCVGVGCGDGSGANAVEQREMCQTCRVHGGRIKKVGPLRAPINAATLRPVCVLAGAGRSGDIEASGSAALVTEKERVNNYRDNITVEDMRGVKSFHCCVCLRITHAPTSNVSGACMWGRG